MSTRHAVTHQQAVRVGGCVDRPVQWQHAGRGRRRCQPAWQHVSLFGAGHGPALVSADQPLQLPYLPPIGCRHGNCWSATISRNPTEFCSPLTVASPRSASRNSRPGLRGCGGCCRSGRGTRSGARCDLGTLRPSLRKTRPAWQRAVRPGPGGSTCCYWNSYGGSVHHPAREQQRSLNSLDCVHSARRAAKEM